MDDTFVVTEGLTYEGGLVWHVNAGPGVTIAVAPTVEIARELANALNFAVRLVAANHPEITIL